MELELKHLSAYFPYGLKVLHGEIKKELTSLSYDSKFGFISTYIGSRQKQMISIGEIKPILIPLSSLTKEIEHDGERFVPIDKLQEIFTKRLRFDIDGFYYEINHSEVRIGGSQPFPFNQLDAYSYIFKWHFDVFGLIDAGLAVDINELKN